METLEEQKKEDGYQEIFDILRKNGVEEKFASNLTLVIWVQVFKQAILTAEKRGKQQADLILCSRKGIHTCRLDAVHIPEEMMEAISNIIKE